MHNPLNTAISFVLMITLVAGSFYYVYALAPRGPWVGIERGLLLNPARAEALQLDQDHGLLIFAITPSSPAAKAGLQQADDEVVISGVTVPIGGDIIVSIDGRQINEHGDLCSALEQKQAGDSVRFTVNRDGSLQETNVILEEAPAGQTSGC